MRNKTAAGLLAIYSGSVGAQHFYLGDKDKGIECILISAFTFGIGAMILSIKGIIDGIEFLKMSDEEFNDKYNNPAIEKAKSASVKNDKKVSQAETEVQKMEKIKKYKDLYDAGVITEFEFLKLKREVLG